MEAVAARIIVRGRVQGVGFRWFARDAAAALAPLNGAQSAEAEGAALRGWVRNRRDGSVELEVAGGAELVAALLGRLRIGPPAASVTAVDVHWLPATPPAHDPAADPSAAPAAAPAAEPGLQIRPTA